MSVLVRSKYTQGSLTTPTNTFNNAGAPGCVTCIKLGRNLDCCKAVCGPCPLCVELDELLTRGVSQQVDDLLTTQIEQTDQIKVRDIRIKELEAQLKAVQETPEKLAEHKREQIDLLNQQYKQEDDKDKGCRRCSTERSRISRFLESSLRQGND
jgi:hypothetical protein